MIRISDDLDDTARLVLMEMKDEGIRSVTIFAHRLRAHGDVSTPAISYLWSKYMGFDTRYPTHDLETGERLR